YWLRCKSSEEDKVSFNLSSVHNGEAIDTGVLISNEYPYGATAVFPIADTPEGGSTEYAPGRRLYVHLDVALPGTTKSLEIDGGGYDIGSSTCTGQLHATISG
ncbi:MAG TPA: hypothetical protein VG448_07445, partial [Solirubrobacterales bacterium]|nr:hypothetical protein [Solirubrobacterales bacterium]